MHPVWFHQTPLAFSGNFPVSGTKIEYVLILKCLFFIMRSTLSVYACVPIIQLPFLMQKFKRILYEERCSSPHIGVVSYKESDLIQLFVHEL